MKLNCIRNLIKKLMENPRTFGYFVGMADDGLTDEIIMAEELVEIGAAVSWNLQSNWHGSISDYEDLETVIETFKKGELNSIKEFKTRYKIKEIL